MADNKARPTHVEPIPAGDTGIAAPVIRGKQIQRWYQGVDRYAWTVLIIAALGWMFDTFDQHLFTLLRQASVTELLRQQYAEALANGTMTDAQVSGLAKEQGAYLTSIFLLGWAAGGFIFGMLGDKLGRTRTMVITILIYAIFTGLNGLVQSMPQYYLCRFMIALGVGGEFAAGASLVAETWPPRSRAMGLGLLQSLSAVGNIMAAITTLILASLSWRWVFAVGAIPALLIVWIRRSVHEPEAWHEAKAEATAAGKAIGTIGGLFSDPVLRRNTIAGVMLATAGVGGVWGVGFFSVDLIGAALEPLVRNAPNIAAIADPKEQEAAIKAGLQHWRSLVFLVQMIGAGLGMFAFAVLAEKTGRRPALGLFLVLAFCALQAFFRFVHDPLTAFLLAFPLGFCTLAPFSAFAIYFPELFPTRLRSTGVGFCYNAARVLAAAAPFTLGLLAKFYEDPLDKTHGFRVAASIVAFIYVFGLIALTFAPETKGKPLPE
ncbi:MAG: MFS transporter [Armatimonadota bacterium]|nr:MFS transporter [Armatimonadota bacterium]